MLKSIKSILIFYVSTLSVLGVLFSAWMLHQQQVLTELRSEDQFADQLEIITSDLMHLTAEQSLRLNVRTAKQWDSRMEALQNLLKISPDSLRQTSDFIQLQSSFFKVELQEKKLRSDSSLHLQSRSMLLLLTQMRQATIDIHAIRQTISAQRVKITSLRTTYTIVFFAVLWLFSLTLAALVLFRIRRPIDQVVAVLNKFGEGDLSVSVPEVETQEIKLVAQTISQMAKNLSVMTVSRNDLLAEVARRTLAEEKLIQHEEQLRIDHMQLLESREHMIQIEKLSSLGTMVGGVAHEINNPLMGVMNYVEYARDKAADDKSREVLDNALHEINRIKKIVQNMLVFVRGDNSRQASCDVRDSVNQTSVLLEGELRKNNVKLEVDLPAALPLVQCSAGSLQQALVNLLLNARDAVADQKDPCITIKVDEAEGSVVLSVSDNGPGVSDEIRQKIFDPFFTTKPVGKGTGLGLSVSRQLIEEAGGSLTLSSEQGHGARFSVVLKPIKIIA